MKQIAIGLLLLLVPITTAQAFQTKDLQSGSVSMKAQLIKGDTISDTTSLTLKCCF